MDTPLWRHEVPLPRQEDYTSQEDYDQAMNMWAHDQLYGWEEDLYAYERKVEFERWLEEHQCSPYDFAEDDEHDATGHRDPDRDC